MLTEDLRSGIWYVQSTSQFGQGFWSEVTRSSGELLSDERKNTIARALTGRKRQFSLEYGGFERVILS